MEIFGCWSAFVVLQDFSPMNCDVSSNVPFYFLPVPVSSRTFQQQNLFSFSIKSLSKTKISNRWHSIVLLQNVYWNEERFNRSILETICWKCGIGSFGYWQTKCICRLIRLVQQCDEEIDLHFGIKCFVFDDCSVRQSKRNAMNAMNIITLK